jgi:hypothetical protein
VSNLPNLTIPAGGYVLVQLAAGNGNGVALPTPDATPTTPTVINMAGAAGKVALVTGSTALNGACPTSSTIVDLVGYGTTANCSETMPAPAPSNTTSVKRAGGGCTDTNNNSTDFTAGAPMPRNSAVTPAPCP